MNHVYDVIVKNKIDLLKVIKELDNKGLMSGSSGNVSIKIDENKYIITPSGIPVFNLQDKDLLLIDSNGKLINNNENDLKPSSEASMHLFCYKKRENIGAIIHSHAPYASAFAITGKSLDLCVMPEIIMVFGRIPLVPYKIPATEKLAEVVSEYIKKDHKALFLENHGVLVTGKDIIDACNNLSIVENYAKTYINALIIGNIKTLPGSEVSQLEELKKKLNFATTEITCDLNNTEDLTIERKDTENRTNMDLVDLISEIVFKEISKRK
jgi:L-fuculose-phosphate aldolase